MRKVSYQLFVKNPIKEFKNLPVTVLMFGRPWAIITAVDPKEEPSKEEKSLSEDFTDRIEALEETVKLLEGYHG